MSSHQGAGLEAIERIYGRRERVIRLVFSSGSGDRLIVKQARQEGSRAESCAGAPPIAPAA